MTSRRYYLGQARLIETADAFQCFSSHPRFAPVDAPRGREHFDSPYSHPEHLDDQPPTAVHPQRRRMTEGVRGTGRHPHRSADSIFSTADEGYFIHDKIGTTRKATVSPFPPPPSPAFFASPNVITPGFDKLGLHGIPHTYRGPIPPRQAGVPGGLSFASYEGIPSTYRGPVPSTHRGPVEFDPSTGRRLSRRSEGIPSTYRGPVEFDPSTGRRLSRRSELSTYRGPVEFDPSTGRRLSRRSMEKDFLRVPEGTAEYWQRPPRRSIRIPGSSRSPRVSIEDDFTSPPSPMSTNREKTYTRRPFRSSDAGRYADVLSTRRFSRMKEEARKHAEAIRRMSATSRQSRRSLAQPSSRRSSQAEATRRLSAGLPAHPAEKITQRLSTNAIKRKLRLKTLIPQWSEETAEDSTFSSSEDESTRDSITTSDSYRPFHVWPRRLRRRAPYGYEYPTISQLSQAYAPEMFIPPVRSTSPRGSRPPGTYV